MKNLLSVLSVFLLLIITTGCQPKEKSNDNNLVEEKANNSLSINGVITSIENGKDGYSATVKAEDELTYKVTISMINLQKSGGEFKRFEVGDTIKAEGEYREDANGGKYLTALQVEKI